MPATLTVGAYNATTHTVALTVTGGDPGELKIYRTWNTDSARVQVVATDPDYDGSSAAVTDHYAAEYQLTYYAYIDGVQQDSDTITVDMEGNSWIISASDTSMKQQLCVPQDRAYTWGERSRRGWYGDVVGTNRTVAVSDVAMSGPQGRFSVLVSSSSEYAAVSRILRQGICCIRGGEPESPGWTLVISFRHRRAGGPRYPRYIDIEWVRTWPTNLTEKLPDA